MSGDKRVGCAASALPTPHGQEVPTDNPTIVATKEGRAAGLYLVKRRDGSKIIADCEDRNHYHRGNITKRNASAPGNDRSQRLGLQLSALRGVWRVSYSPLCTGVIIALRRGWDAKIVLPAVAQLIDR